MSFQIRPKLRSKLPQAIAAVIIATASSAALADELTTPPAPSAESRGPARGTSMDKVEATFGAPSERFPAVGAPPITRWKYPGFEVYFEHQLVIHTVVTG